MAEVGNCRRHPRREDSGARSNIPADLKLRSFGRLRRAVLGARSYNGLRQARLLRAWATEQVFLVRPTLNDAHGVPIKPPRKRKSFLGSSSEPRLELGFLAKQHRHPLMIDAIGSAFCGVNELNDSSGPLVANRETFFNPSQP